jgi:hypothetical protein
MIGNIMISIDFVSPKAPSSLLEVIGWLKLDKPHGGDHFVRPQVGFSTGSGSPAPLLGTLMDGTDIWSYNLRLLSD